MIIEKAPVFWPYAGNSARMGDPLLYTFVYGESSFMEDTSGAAEHALLRGGAGEAALMAARESEVRLAGSGRTLIGLTFGAGFSSLR